MKTFGSNSKFYEVILNAGEFLADVKGDDELAMEQ
jgi:hypothetical protein